MDSSEDAAAAKRSSINDASPTAVQQASTEPKTTEANMGVHQHINSTTEIQMEMPSLHDYITKLSEEEWESIAADMSNPVTKSQFLTVCLNIANYITSSALHVIIPSLIKRLGEDPELLMGSEEDRGNINVIGTCPDSRSSTSLHTTSLPQHGMTKEHILQSVQRSLTKLNEAGLTPDSDEWIEAIVAEVVHAVDSLLKSRPHSTGCASPHQRSRITEIAKNISLKLKTYLTQQYKTSKETIGDILINKVKAVHSTSTRPFSSPISVLGSEINMEEDERSPSCSPQPIHSVSSMIVNTFVEELSSLIECTECRRQSHADQEINEIKNGEPFAVPKSQVLEAAKGLYVKVQAKITQFFKNPLVVCCKGLSTPDIDRMEAKVLQSMEAPSAQYSQHPGVQPTSIGSEQLLRPAWPLLRKMHSDGTYCVALGELNLTKTQLEECTNNALGGVLTSFLSQESEEPCSSSSTNTFMERVIFQLDSLISTSSLTTSVSSSDHSSKYSLVNFMRISDSTSTNSSSNLQKLSSEAFQTNAHLAVSEAVLKTVIGQDSSQMQNQHLPVQVSSFFFFPVKRDTPDTEVLELGTANVDIDSAASAMVGQFDTDLQGCVEALHPNKVETDKPHKRDFFTTASHFSESISECEQPPLEEQNLHPVADPSGTTKEVLSKVLTLYKDEMVGQNAECDITPAVSTQDKNRLLHLEAYFATPESPLQGSVEDYSNQTVTSVQDTAQQIAADVLLSAVRIISDSSDSYKVNPQISPVEAENVAPDLVTEVTNEVQKLLEATASTDTPASPCSDVEECIAKDLQSSHIFQTTVEDKVLAFLQEELTQSTDMDNSEDLQIDSIGGTNAQSSFFFFPVKRDAPDTEVLELGTANVDIDSAASAMVGQFDTDLQGCVEALHPNKVETDKPHKRDFFTTASHFSESISECEQPPLEEQNLHPVADPSGTTKEVLSKVLTLYKDEMVGQNAECDITPAVSTQDKNRLLHLEAYFATPESPLQGSVEDYSNQTVTSVQDTAQQIAADVLLSAVRIISDSSDSYKVDPQISPVEAENVAPDLVTEVTNEVQKLLEATASTDTPASPCSDVEECIAKDLQSSHIFQTTVEDKVLAFLQEELTQSTDMDNSEDLQIDSIGGTNAQLMEEPQRPNANLLCASKCKLSESNFENEDCTVSPSQVPTSVREKLEKILCSERLNPHSHNLSNQIHHLYFKSQKGMTATKSVSDPLLVSVEEGGEFHRKRIVRQITQVYAEEMVKHCLLPCFNIPSDWTMEVGEHFQSASSSASCPSFLYSLSEVPKGASKSPSQILQNTLLVLIKTMIKDVMNILDLTLQSPEETEDQTDLQLLPDSTRLFRRPSSGEPAQMSLSEDIVIDSLDPLLTLVNSTSDDYTSLVTILVIRLLSKLNDQEPLTDDMLDISRSLIERIVTDIDAVLGPHGVRLRKVFRAIYNDLLHEFGSKEILLRVMMSEDPWFEKTLVTGEITSVTAKPKEGKPKKPTFLSKFSKMKAFLAIKRSKPSNNKKQSTNGDHPTTAQVDPTDRCAGCLPCVALFASGDKTVEKKPCKGFFSRMISRLSKKSSKIHPRTLD